MTAPIPQSNPKANYLAHQVEIDAAIARVLDGGWYILGEEVSAFEREFAAFVGVSDVVGVANGTDAVALALRAGGIQPGDGVVTVSHTAVATVAAIEMAGAVPLLVDIDSRTFTLDVNSLTKLLRESAPAKKIKALVVVHLYGHPADMPAIMEIARRHGLFVVEDCAQSHGAALDGRATGQWGNIAAFSFYPTKNLGALGDGGAVATSDPALARQVRLLREYGWRERYISQIAGGNSRLDELQAAILRVKLRHLSSENARRRAVAAIYSESLANTSLALPQTRAGVEHVFHQYVIRSQNRDALRAHLKENAIGSLIHYPQPVHLQPAYRDRAVAPGGLPQTESAAREVLSLPMHPQLTEAEVREVAETIVRWNGK